MRWIGAFFACASSTSRMMRASAVSAPTAVVRTTRRPSALIGAAGDAIARRPWRPAAIRPSATTRRRGCGRPSPRRRPESVPRAAPPPRRRCVPRAIGTSASAPCRRTRATFGRNACSARIACRRLALGTGLEPFAQQHQRDHDCGRLEVEVRRRVPRVAGQPVMHAQAVGRARADRDQQVHVAGARLQRLPGAGVEPASRARTAPASRARTAATAGRYQFKPNAMRSSARPAAARAPRRTRRGGLPSRVHPPAQSPAAPPPPRGAARPCTRPSRPPRREPGLGARPDLDRRLLGREVHHGAGDARHPAERALDTCRAGRTGHAADREPQGRVGRGSVVEFVAMAASCSFPSWEGQPGRRDAAAVPVARWRAR